MTAPYNINLDAKYGFRQLIDVPGLVAECEHKWFNQTLCRVNDCVVRLGILEGEFHWHTHEKEDEFFFVLDGTLLVDLEGETISLEAHRGFAVPRGTLHRTRRTRRTVVLMVEGGGVRPTGDDYTPQ